MPIRPRRSRRHRNALTVSAYVDLSIGPAGEPTPYHELLFVEHRRRFLPGDWCVSFDQGVDTRGSRSADPADAVELEPHGLPPGCQQRAA